MTRYGMAVDLERCTGCYGCVTACKVENGVPKGVFWRRVLTRVDGEYPNAERTRYSISCMHCGSPPCRDVCPTGATHKRDDGIVSVDYEKCIGCRYCMMACPYEARSFLEGGLRAKVIDSTHDGYFDQETPYDQALRTKGRDDNRSIGIVTKCDFCAHRIDDGRDPACVEDCPTNALIFGDLEDPDSTLSRTIRRRNGEQLRPEAGTDPGVYLLPKLSKQAVTDIRTADSDGDTPPIEQAGRDSRNDPGTTTAVIDYEHRQGDDQAHQSLGENR